MSRRGQAFEWHRLLRPGVWGPPVAVTAGGALLACAFPMPPWGKGLEGASAAWLALVPLIIVARCSSRRAAFRYGWLGGMAFWLLSLVWLLQLRHTWGYLPVVLLCWGGLAAYCSLYSAVFAWLIAACFPWRAGVAQRGRDLLLLAAAPLFWSGLETLRGSLLTGFPWNALGVSQARNLALLQLASVGGTALVSALLVLVNTALALLALGALARVRRLGPARRFHPELMVALTACAAAWIWGTWEFRRVDADHAVTVFQAACVQPAIPQPLKWDDAAADMSYEVLYKQSLLAVHLRPDLLIWPETAIPHVLRYDPVAQSIVHEVVTNGVPLLLGSMDSDTVGGDRQWFNSALLVDTNAVISGLYHKRHLVPFGEYIPLERVIPLLHRLAPLGFSCTPGDGPVVFDLPLRERDGRPRGSLAFAVLICFEDILPYLARDARRHGARVLINLTNDAWFDGSSAAEQHMLHAVFRAVENRIPMIRSTNTGLTCFIERTGRISEHLWLPGSATPVEGIAFNSVAVPTGDSGGWYARLGDWSFGWPAAVLTLGVILLVIRPRRRHDADTRDTEKEKQEGALS